MADTRVEDEVAVSSLTGLEYYYVVQAGSPRKATTDQIALYASAPPTSDGRALGSLSLQWSDLFLASGAVVNYGGGNVLITHSAGNLAITGLGSGAFAIDGPLNLGAAGKIVFPATQAASANANTLDDYEEGTFTPTITFGGNNVGMTFNIKVGTYTKIGNQVRFMIRALFTAKGSSTGNMSVNGLPFANNTDYTASCCWVDGLLSTRNTPAQALINSGGTTVSLAFVTSGGQSIFQDTDITNSSALYIAGVYQAP